MYCRTTSAIDRPPCRTEAINVVKSWMPPMKTDPTRIQIHVGNHPKSVPARMGPTIGPAAAMAEKCCGSKYDFLAASKSRPSRCSCAGVRASGSSAK